MKYYQTLLRTLPHEVAGELERMARPMNVRPGQVISSFGEPMIAAVRRGWFKLVGFSADGEQQFVALRRRGRLIGLEAAAGAKVELPEVVSLVSGELLIWTLEEFSTLMANTATLAWRVAANIAEQAEEDFHFRRQAQTVRLTPRLALLLYTLALEEGETTSSGYRVPMPFSQRELADLLEVRRETVSVKVCQLENAGLIERWGRELVIDAERMRHYLVSSGLHLETPITSAVRPAPNYERSIPLANGAFHQMPVFDRTPTEYAND
jgi:CRP-like cAMP-binding protein